MTAPGIEVRGLSLHVGDRRLFDNLSFTVPGGQWVSLLGASGAGKTSLLRVMAGLAPATRGEVVASDGQPIQGRLAWMGQKDLLYPWLSVRDNVALGARLRGAFRCLFRGGCRAFGKHRKMWNHGIAMFQDDLGRILLNACFPSITEILREKWSAANRYPFVLMSVILWTRSECGE